MRRLQSEFPMVPAELLEYGDQIVRPVHQSQYAYQRSDHTPVLRLQGHREEIPGGRGECEQQPVELLRDLVEVGAGEVPAVLDVLHQGGDGRWRCTGWGEQRNGADPRVCHQAASQCSRPARVGCTGHAK